MDRKVTLIFRHKSGLFLSETPFVLFVQCVSGVLGDIKFVKVPFFNTGLCFVKVGMRLDYAPSSSYFLFFCSISPFLMGRYLSPVKMFVPERWRSAFWRSG